MDDVIAGRQHDVRGRAALLADQLERAGVVGLVGEHPPHQPAVDDRHILAVARRQRQHPLSWNCGRCWRRYRRNRRDRRWHDGGLVQRRRRDRSCPRRRRQIHGGPGLDIRNRGRRHRWRAVREHLGRGRDGKQGDQRQCKRQRRERPSAPPESNDTVTARVIAMLFTENAANSSLRSGSSGRQR